LGRVRNTSGQSCIEAKKYKREALGVYDEDTDWGGNYCGEGWKLGGGPRRKRKEGVKKGRARSRSEVRKNVFLPKEGT